MSVAMNMAGRSGTVAATAATKAFVFTIQYGKKCNLSLDVVGCVNTTCQDVALAFGTRRTKGECFCLL